MKVKGFPKLVLCAAFLVLAVAMPARSSAEEWLPISQADLALKDNPKQKGDHAMVLAREERTDCAEGQWTVYVRLKIFDERGRDYANVETQSYGPAVAQINNIKGRTIHPDGSIVPFGGEVLEKVIAKRGATRSVAKTFVLPQVTPGSIIEYRYTLSWNKQYAYPVVWLVQGPLFQRQAHFVFIPMEPIMLRPSPGTPQWNAHLAAHTSALFATPSHEPFSWSSFLLPPNQVPVMGRTVAGGKHGKLSGEGEEVTLDIADLPGYQVEPLMPPLEEVRASVHFFHFPYWYSPPSLDDFWKKTGSVWNAEAEGFMNKRDAAEGNLSSLLGPSDGNDAKLRKIYDRVQSLRNLSYEPLKSEPEIKREKEKPTANIADVLQRGYGDHDELNRVFVALARSAGLDATLVKVAERDKSYFEKTKLTMWQLRSEIVLVRDGSKELYLDPGTPFCPFGVIPWEDTTVMGMRLDKNPPVFVSTASLNADDSAISRKADLQLKGDGSVEGTIEVTFTGQEALDPRLDERDADEAARKNYMQELLRQWLPAAATVELQKVNDWKASSLPLVATYHIAIPAYAATTGHETILPTALFARAYASPFVDPRRKSNIIFPYPYVHTDEVAITLPPGLQAGNLPAAKSQHNGLGEFSAHSKIENGVLHATRQFRLDDFVVEAKYYPAVRRFFGQVADTKDEQVVLKSVAN
jgi:hypothetical protein